MSTIQGFYCKQRKGIAPLYSLLSSWLKVLEEYSRHEEGDQLYWYNEMANVSGLSAAAWQAKMVSICQFQHQKGHKHSKYKFYGRADLYISTGQHGYYVEAKHDNVSLTPKYDDWETRLGSKMTIAVKDAYQSSNGGEYDCLAVAFWVLNSPKSREQHIEADIARLVAFIEDKPFHAAAWYFPENARSTRFCDGRVYPGVVMGIENRTYTRF